MLLFYVTPKWQFVYRSQSTSLVKVWVSSRRSFPISFGQFSRTYVEACQTERYVQETEGESTNKLTISLHDQQGKQALKQPLSSLKEPSLIYF